MTDDKQLYNLSRRRVLGGLGAIGLASAGAGLGTSAFLSDTESFENSVITAGTLDLLVGYYSYWDQGNAGSGAVSGSQNGDGTVSGVLTDVKPGDSGLLAFCPTIETNPAYLWLCGELTSNAENAVTEPEGDIDTTPDVGELAENIHVDVNYCDVADDVGEGFDPGDVTHVADIWEGSLADFLSNIQNGVPLDGDANSDSGETGFLAPGEQECFAGSAAESENVCLCVAWEVPTSVGNVIQADSIEFDLEFHAEQCRHNDGTHNPCADETECAACELPSGLEPSPDLSILSTDASGYPSVSLFAQVDTPAGNNGELTASDFTVCENGLAQDESVTFQSNRKADIVFVFDDTGSMGEEISGAQNAINTFVNDIDSSLDARYALISFKDSVQLDQDFTSTPSQIQAAVNGLSASGGGNFREDNFDALAVATQNEGVTLQEGGSPPALSAYRPGAQRVIIDITDAAAHTETTTESSGSPSGQVTDLNMSEVEAMLGGYTYIVASQPLSSTYANGDKQVLAQNVGGKWFDLPESDSEAFADFLVNEVGGLLVTTYEITYTTCDSAADGTQRDITLEVNDPSAGDLYAFSTYTAPSA